MRAAVDLGDIGRLSKKIHDSVFVLQDQSHSAGHSLPFIPVELSSAGPTTRKRRCAINSGHGGQPSSSQHRLVTAAQPIAKGLYVPD